MEHKLSKVKVYQTDDYGRFQIIEGNRAINKRKIARIIAEIKSGNDVLDECPILVTEKKNKLPVKDGQHRFLVAKELGRPVSYIIKSSEMSLYNVAKINNNTEKWTQENFLKAYVVEGDENYKQLDRFYRKYGFAIGTCLVLLYHGIEKTKGRDRQTLQADFQQGSFKVLKYKEAVMFAEIVKNFSAFSAWQSRSFVLAILKIVQCGAAEMDTLQQKFQKDPSRLRVQSNEKGYLANLQEIYNIGNSKQRIIY